MAELTILLSVDPETNRFRFFVLELRRRDDGSAELHKRWGRIGTERQHAIEEFSTVRLAETTRAALIDRRLPRGYVRVRLSGADDAPSALEPLVTWEARLAYALEHMRRNLAGRREALQPQEDRHPAQLALPL